MQAHLAGVDVGEEVFADDEGKGQREKDEDAEEDQRDGGIGEAPLERAFIAFAHALELAIEALVPAPNPIAFFLTLRLAFVLVETDLGREQKVHHRGHERTGEEVGGQHGEGDGLSQGGEEVFRCSGEQHDRDEDDADGKSGDEGGRGNLLGGVEDGADQGLLFGHIAVRIFDLDGSVVDEDADGESEAAKGHHVDGLAQRGENGERGSDRERDRGADDEGRAPGAEKKQDHQAGEGGGDGGLASDFVDGIAHEDGLVEQRNDLQVGRQTRDDSGNGFDDAVDDVDGAGLAIFEHGE